MLFTCNNIRLKAYSPLNVDINNQDYSLARKMIDHDIEIQQHALFVTYLINYIQVYSLLKYNLPSIL